MNKFITIYLACFCLYGTNYFAQGGHFLLADNRVPIFYVNIKNPVNVILCSSKERIYRLKPFKGKIDTIRNSIYWTPFALTSRIYIEQNIESSWAIVDTVRSKVLYIDPEYITIEAKPISFHGGLPQLSRFTHFKVVDDGEYNHLNLDSIAWLYSLNAMIKSSTGEILDSIFYSQSFSQSEKDAFQKRIRSMDRGESLTLSNIKLKGDCWCVNGKYDIITLSKDIYIKNWL